MEGGARENDTRSFFLLSRYQTDKFLKSNWKNILVVQTRTGKTHLLQREQRKGRGEREREMKIHPFMTDTFGLLNFILCVHVAWSKTRFPKFYMSLEGLEQTQPSAWACLILPVWIHPSLLCSITRRFSILTASWKNWELFKKIPTLRPLPRPTEWESQRGGDQQGCLKKKKKNSPVVLNMYSGLRTSTLAFYGAQIPALTL